MSEVKLENTNTNTNTSTTTNFKNSKIDISPILKDVENCIKSGLGDKLQSFFYDFETYEKTHNEVLNLTVVKNLVNHNNLLVRVVNKSVCKSDIKKRMKYHRLILKLKRKNVTVYVVVIRVKI